MSVAIAINWFRCTSGVELRRFEAAPQSDPCFTNLGGDWRAGQEFFINGSGQEENIKILRRDHSNPLVLEFADAETDVKLIEFFSKYGLPSSDINGHQKETNSSDVRSWRESIRETHRLLASDVPRNNTLTWLNQTFSRLKFASLKPAIQLEKGLPEATLVASNLYAFMLAELMFMAAGNIRFAICPRCGRFFVTGPNTGRTLKAEFCRPACRVAAARVRIGSKAGKK